MGYLERAQQHVQAAAQIRWRPLYPAPEESLCLKRLLSCDVQFPSQKSLQKPRESVWSDYAGKDKSLRLYECLNFREKTEDSGEDNGSVAPVLSGEVRCVPAAWFPQANSKDEETMIRKRMLLLASTQRPFDPESDDKERQLTVFSTENRAQIARSNLRRRIAKVRAIVDYTANHWVTVMQKHDPNAEAETLANHMNFPWHNSCKWFVDSGPFLSHSYKHNFDDRVDNIHISFKFIDTHGHHHHFRFLNANNRNATTSRLISEHDASRKRRQDPVSPISEYYWLLDADWIGTFKDIRSYCYGISHPKRSDYTTETTRTRFLPLSEWVDTPSKFGTNSSSDAEHREMLSGLFEASQALSTLQQRYIALVLLNAARGAGFEDTSWFKRGLLSVRSEARFLKEAIQMHNQEEQRLMHPPSRARQSPSPDSPEVLTDRRAIEKLARHIDPYAKMEIGDETLHWQLLTSKERRPQDRQSRPKIVNNRFFRLFNKK